MKGKIYKIVDDNNKTYYGSTIQKYLCNRLAQHKCMKKYMTKDFINPKIYLVEEKEFTDKKEMLLLEADYIKSNECINKVVPLRTRKEWRNLPEQKEKTKVYNKNYNELNCEKDKIKFTCICGSISRLRDKSKHDKTKKHIKFVSIM